MVPEEAISPAKIAARSVVLLIKVVVLAVPFHCTVELLMKSVPVNVNAKEDPPEVAVLGAMPAKAGRGLGGVIV